MMCPVVASVISVTNAVPPPAPVYVPVGISCTRWGALAVSVGQVDDKAGAVLSVGSLASASEKATAVPSAFQLGMLRAVQLSPSSAGVSGSSLTNSGIPF